MRAFATAVIFSLFLSVSAAYAFSVTDGGKYIVEGVITEGGGNSSGTGYMAIGASGQPAIGWITGGPYKMCLGAFCTYMFEPGYSVRLSGKLKYGDSRAVSSSDAWVEVDYMTNRFIGGKNKTDSSGNFNARVAIPEYFYDKNFDIKIYASGEVESVYECSYNQATDRCS